MEIKVGDVVTLNSGSPKMTVMKVCKAKPVEAGVPGSVATPEMIETAWFDEHGCVMRGSFPPEALGTDQPKVDVKPGEVKPE